MLKSLYSGVSGLQAHQIAMDVESNNIANVNTTGFKYSRANFSDLLAQTKAIATAPQGELGGKNPVQVGLGSTVSSTTRIFSQGSVQNSDKNTDVAIQGDGFFIVSPDGGNTYKYTRAGDFKFDAGGNFVDNNGFIVQGWLRDPVTGFVDSTAPITNINIPPGLTTPAQPTQNVVIKANLDSGPLVDTFSPAYTVPSGIPNSVTNVGEGDAFDANGNDIASDDMGIMFNDSGEAFNLQTGQGIWVSFTPSTVTSNAVSGGNADLDITLTLDDGTTQQITADGIAGNTADQNGALYVSAINAYASTTGITANYNTTTDEIVLTNPNNNQLTSHNIRLAVNVGDTSGAFVTADTETAYRYTYDSTGGGVPAIGNDKTFRTIAELRYAMEQEAQDVSAGSAIVIDEQGKFKITNLGVGNDLTVAITGMDADSVAGGGITENELFTRSMEALNSTIPTGSPGIALSQAFNAATHSASIDIFDSLGSKHTLRTEFRKVAVDAYTGSTWTMLVSVPEPAEIDTVVPLNEKEGFIRFNSDGSLATYSPPNISFTGNNGSSPNQQVSLELGTANSFDGMTSFDAASTTSGISQDGFTGGDLVGIRIDQSGTLVGSFSNGRSFGLAQIGMAKFTNNEGLSTEGGNVYTQTANSGDPIIGTAATAGRGFMQASALEASNVDLSLSLTQLIIIQRGYQANGKTITTSDTLLETLIGLKR
ncbi:MAG: flagellar hook protein FlgE [Sulfurimonas sp.]|jgi:flagellar hook protein FlgE